VWYDADQITGLSDSDPVATWPDAGPHGDDVTQGTAAKRPLYKTGILNGKPVVRFDGNDDYLQGAFTNAGATTQPLTIFAVAQLNAALVNDDNAYVICDGVNSGTRSQLYKTEAPDPDAWALYSGAVLTDGAADADWNIWAALFNGASSELWIDGVSVASGDAGAQAMSGLTIGTSYACSGVYWSGDIAEIIVYDANLSDIDKNEVGNYLATKYGPSWTDI